MKEIEATISGRVQLVLFRDFMQRKARALRICGFIRNNKDGTVTVIAQGDDTVLERFIGYAREGSFLSKVESVNVEYRMPGRIYSDFLISY